ncbi:MAG: VCBS repeat-containing protein, partial [Tepidisphaeraceae bacterium]
CPADGRPGVLVSTQGAPILLAAQPDGWKQIPLPKSEGNIGRVSPCIVADLDNDGCVDILQPGETGGVLWRGKDGSFHEPVKSPVCTGGGVARHAVADFNEDGFADIFLSGAEKNTLWENDGKAAFTDVLRFAGSVSYKCPPGAAIAAIDLNHDGRADLCLGYPNGDLKYHFNRGFRSLAEENELRLPGAGRVGLLSFASADFNGDGSADLAVLQSDGTVRVYFNDRIDAPALLLRLPKGITGPVTVSCWTAEKIPTMTGFAIVPGHAPGVYLPIRDKGTVHLKYRFPARPPATMSVKVADGTSEVVLD